MCEAKGKVLPNPKCPVFILPVIFKAKYVFNRNGNILYMLSCETCLVTKLWIIYYTHWMNLWLFIFVLFPFLTCVNLTLPTKMVSFLEHEGYVLSFCSSPSGMHRRLLCETLNKYGWLNWTFWTYIVVWSSVNSGEVFEDWVFIFIVGNLSNEKNSEMQLPIKLIFGWRERIKLMKEIWECPAQDIVWHNSFCGRGKRIATTEE